MTTAKGVVGETGNDSTIGLTRPEWLPGAGDEREAPSAERDPLASDEVFEILRNPRRRLALRILSNRDGSMGLTDLSVAIAAIENDKRSDGVTTAERKRVYISLYQCHVSKMVDADVVEYDAENRIVRITPRGLELAEGLAAFSDDGAVADVYPVISAIAIVLSLAAFSVSRGGAAMLLLGIGLSFAATSMLRE